MLRIGESRILDGGGEFGFDVTQILALGSGGFGVWFWCALGAAWGSEQACDRRKERLTLFPSRAAETQIASGKARTALPWKRYGRLYPLSTLLNATEWRRSFRLGAD